MAYKGASPELRAYEASKRRFRSLLGFSDAEIAELEAVAQARAITSMSMTQARLVSELIERIERREGDMLYDTLVADLVETIDNVWLDAEAGSRLDKIVFSNNQYAYGSGRFEQAEETGVPYVKFVAILDAATTTECAEAHGTVLPVDDPYWDKTSPPLHYGCRCELQFLSEDEARAEGVSRKGPDIDKHVQEGFGINTWAGVDPDLDSLAGPVADLLSGKLR